MKSNKDQDNITKIYRVGGRFTILQVMVVVAIVGLILTVLLRHFFG